ncbi:protein of unknown function [Methylocaldum szegediense]|jgi:hypothetical protein|uniref:Uncharacterized protein n=1 Tax=Methylocaldum szegediense TaxID=73780 RepID=A0ABM9I8A0_9GAMM|nr:protein of unknown function [Methylocaldum szegediense]
MKKLGLKLKLGQALVKTGSGFGILITKRNALLFSSVQLPYIKSTQSVSVFEYWKIVCPTDCVSLIYQEVSQKARRDEDFERLRD